MSGSAGEPWLDIVGIGEDGRDGLSSAARAAIDAADVLIGGERHHALVGPVQAERLTWPSPFDAMVEKIQAHRGRRVAVLVTGDPLWYSAGTRLSKAIPGDEIRFHPQPSAFQWVAARMGWSLADVETLTVHGRPSEHIVPYLAPAARLIVLAKDRSSPAEIARCLTDAGYGPSRITALASLGGPHEQRYEGTADSWSAEVPDFHTLAIECNAAPDADIIPRGPGLPDEAFRHDGKMTKQEVRAATLAKLWPRRGALLWDIGTGCGSIAIEWMRAAPDAQAIGLEPNPDRREIAMDNARRLGAPRLKIVDAEAPDGLAGLPDPQAIFIGGGLSEETLALCHNRLPRHGRLVANAVTLESEAVLAEAHATYGGQLVRIGVSRATAIGGYRGWRALMPVTQWSVVT